jgi:hypothetical protein
MYAQRSQHFEQLNMRFIEILLFLLLPPEQFWEKCLPST